MARTEISYINDRSVAVECGNMRFVTAPQFISETKCEGYWDSNLMAFIPRQVEPHPADIEPYTDNSSFYYESCVVCAVATGGNRYCGPSCERYEEEGGDRQAK